MGLFQGGDNIQGYLFLNLFKNVYFLVKQSKNTLDKSLTRVKYVSNSYDGSSSSEELYIE